MLCFILLSSLFPCKVQNQCQQELVYHKLSLIPVRTLLFCEFLQKMLLRFVSWHNFFFLILKRLLILPRRCQKWGVFKNLCVSVITLASSVFILSSKKFSIYGFHVKSISLLTSKIGLLGVIEHKITIVPLYQFCHKYFKTLNLYF